MILFIDVLISKQIIISFNHLSYTPMVHLDTAYFAENWKKKKIQVTVH